MLAKRCSTSYSMMWAEKFSDSRNFKKNRFLRILLTYYVKLAFSTTISSLHITSVPFCDHLKCFPVAAASIISLAMFLRETMANLYFSAWSCSVLRFQKFCSYRSDAFMRSIWNAVTFVGSFHSKPVGNFGGPMFFVYITKGQVPEELLKLILCPDGISF